MTDLAARGVFLHRLLLTSNQPLSTRQKPSFKTQVNIDSWPGNTYLVQKKKLKKRGTGGESKNPFDSELVEKSKFTPVAVQFGAVDIKSRSRWLIRAMPGLGSRGAGGVEVCLAQLQGFCANRFQLLSFPISWCVAAFGNPCVEVKAVNHIDAFTVLSHFYLHL